MRSAIDTPTVENAPAPAASAPPEKVPAGRLDPWEVDTLDAPPVFSWRKVTALIGPGILLAGSSVGAGEWLFGPAVSAQFGGTFLWLATISIVTQTFYNLEVMRYTLYTGEPIFAGYFRVAPGPKFWTAIYLTLCIAHIWPFMAANAAVPLAAAILGHLPGDAVLSSSPSWFTFGATPSLTESNLVKVLGYAIFLLAFLPLIFGGKIYNMLEKMMTWKLIIVLGFLISVTGFLTSPRNVWEVCSGFFRFGQVAIRADSVVAGPQFQWKQQEGTAAYTIKGTMEKGKAEVTAFVVSDGEAQASYSALKDVPEKLLPIRQRLLDQVTPLAVPGHFLVDAMQRGSNYRIDGKIEADGKWQAALCTIKSPDGNIRTVEPDKLAGGDAWLVKSLVDNQGFVRRGIIGYTREHGKLPPLDFPLLAAFAAIAGAGMLSNALFSNYARDKGWGMGSKTGAIPSAIGGHQFSLAHVGKVFVVDGSSLAKWRGWFKHIFRDQMIWMFCSVIGLALPCMLSLEFIRNAPVSGDRVAALTADGLSSRFPSYAGFWWVITLFVSFIVLAPNAVFGGDLIARLWTDIIWIGSKKAKEQPARSVSRIYYSILAIYGVWGMAALTLLNPLQTAKVGPILGNVALGFSAFHTLAVNRTLLPKPLRPNLIMQLGLFACGVFFLSITAIVVASMF